jgi:hypothetical protein
MWESRNARRLSFCVVILSGANGPRVSIAGATANLNRKENTVILSEASANHRAFLAP